MIIDTPYKVGDTVSIKLSSGEEMIARLEEENDNHVIIRKPLMLIAGQSGGMGLAPFMFTVDQDAKVKLKNNSIICIVKTAKDANDTYIKSTTGLAVVN